MWHTASLDFSISHPFQLFACPILHASFPGLHCWCLGRPRLARVPALHLGCSYDLSLQPASLSAFVKLSFCETLVVSYDLTPAFDHRTGWLWKELYPACAVQGVGTHTTGVEPSCTNAVGRVPTQQAGGEKFKNHRWSPPHVCCTLTLIFTV